MQAPAKSTHQRSLNVPARLPEREPAPVLGLELAARQPPAAEPQVAVGRGRRGLMLAVCCLSLFIYRANASPVGVAQTTVEAFTGFLPVLAGFSSSRNR